jgi:hypothetical protein
MANNSIGKWLQNQKEVIEKQVEEGKELKGLSELPFGTYNCVILKHECKQASNEKWGILSQFLVLDGPQTGEMIFNWTDLEREDAFKWLIPTLKNCGIEDIDAEDIMKELQKNEDDVFNLAKNKTVVKVLISKSTNGEGREFVNKRVTKFLPDYEVDDDFIEQAKAMSKSKKKSSDDDESSEPEKEEETPDSSEEAGMEIHAGYRVTFTQGRATKSGVVTAVNEDDMIVTVKLPDGKEVEIGADAIKTSEKVDSEKV